MHPALPKAVKIGQGGIIVLKCPAQVRADRFQPAVELKDALPYALGGDSNPIKTDDISASSRNI
ncbi:MAG: hypothetical protein ACREBV_08555 [Candidatus Zixiibacteriota bacterium]